MPPDIAAFLKQERSEMLTDQGAEVVKRLLQPEIDLLRYYPCNRFPWYILGGTDTSSKAAHALICTRFQHSEMHPDCLTPVCCASGDIVVCDEYECRSHCWQCMAAPLHSDMVISEVKC